jgi:hypothetical protein
MFWFSRPARAAHQLAVIVPFRADDSVHGQGRAAHLQKFIPYLRQFLERAATPFRLLVVEQTPGALFNKGMLLNAGIQLSPPECDYFVFHDVDQLPEHPRNTYSYPGRKPLHLCSGSSQFGHRLPYKTYVGGALAMTRVQCQKVNGFSNCYWGWGLEDDDMHLRIRRRLGRLARLPCPIGRYRALPHPRLAQPWQAKAYLDNRAYIDRVLAGQVRSQDDGLDNVCYQVVAETHAETDHFLVDLPNAKRA